MKHTVKEHLSHFLPLAIVCLTGLFLALQFSYDPRIQMAILIAVAMFYVAWGVVHHITHHTFATKIVVEYVLIASIFAVLASLFIQYSL